MPEPEACTIAETTKVPSLSESIFRETDKDRNPDLEKVLDRLETLERKLDLVFNDHILINGRFTKITL